MEISKRDLTKLAILLNKTSHSVEFPEMKRFPSYAGKTLRLIEILEKKYQDFEFLDGVRQAVNGAVDDKMRFYTVVRNVLATAHASIRDMGEVSAVQFTPIAVDGFMPLTPNYSPAPVYAA